MYQISEGFRSVRSKKIEILVLISLGALAGKSHLGRLNSNIFRPLDAQCSLRRRFNLTAHRKKRVWSFFPGRYGNELSLPRKFLRLVLWTSLFYVAGNDGARKFYAGWKLKGTKRCCNSLDLVRISGRCHCSYYWRRRTSCALFFP